MFLRCRTHERPEIPIPRAIPHLQAMGLKDLHAPQTPGPLAPQASRLQDVHWQNFLCSYAGLMVKQAVDKAKNRRLGSRRTSCGTCPCHVGAFPSLTIEAPLGILLRDSAPPRAQVIWAHRGCVRKFRFIASLGSLQTVFWAATCSVAVQRTSAPRPLYPGRYRTCRQGVSRTCIHRTPRAHSPRKLRGFRTCICKTFSADMLVLW